MATRGSIPTQMAAMGIDMLAPAAGIAALRRELTAGGTRGEVVIGGALGIMTAEFDQTGGLDVDRVELAAEMIRLPALPTRGPVAGRVTGMGIWSGLTVEITLEPAGSGLAALDPPASDGAQPSAFADPFTGSLVLPDATVVDSFVQVARLPVPDRQVGGVTHIDVGEPVRLHPGEPSTLTIRAIFMPAQDALVAHCELTSSRRLAGHSDPHVTVHATGRVRLDEIGPPGS